MTDTANRADFIAKHVADMEARRDKLIHALDENDHTVIWAWDVLALGQTAEGEAFVTTVLNAVPASDIKADAIRNGNGVLATRQRRQAVIAASLEGVLESIETFKNFPID